MSIRTQCEQYFDARAAYDEAHALSSARHAEMKKAERDVIDARLEEGTQSVAFGEGLAVSLRNQFSVSCTDANNQSWRDWLIETEGDDTPYVKQVIDKKSVTDLLKKKIEACEIGIDDVPAEFSINTTPALYVRGWNSR